MDLSAIHKAVRNVCLVQNQKSPKFAEIAGCGYLDKTFSLAVFKSRLAAPSNQPMRVNFDKSVIKEVFYLQRRPILGWGIII